MPGLTISGKQENLSNSHPRNGIIKQFANIKLTTFDQWKPKPKTPTEPKPIDFGTSRFDEGGYVPIEITLEKSFTSFYIRRNSDLPSLAELTKNMDAWYNFKFVQQQELLRSEIRLGEFYAARCAFKESDKGLPEGEHWIRVRVFCKKKTNNRRIRVARIDHGGVYNCELKDLRFLISDHRKLPWTAYYSKFEAVSGNYMFETLTENFLASVDTARRFGKQLLGLPMREYFRYPPFIKDADMPPFPFVPVFIRAEDPNSNFVQNFYPEVLRKKDAEEFDTKMATFWGNRTEHSTNLQRSSSLPSVLWDPEGTFEEEKPIRADKNSKKPRNRNRKTQRDKKACLYPNDYFFGHSCLKE